MTKEENKHAIITLKTEWVDMDKLVLTNEKGDTYTTKSEELMDFILSSESENERLKAEREWTIDFDGKLMAGIKIVNGELSIIGAMDGYADGISISKIVIKPQSPKQSCPQCKTEYTKEELLTNEHCFKCGFEMKGF